MAEALSPVPVVMVGGGPASLIGPVHRVALARDGAFRLVAGRFSSDAARSAAFGAGLGLPAQRCQGSLAALVEQARADHPGQPVAAVVCSPNDTHAQACTELLGLGVHVACDKPLAATPGEVEAIAAEQQRSGCALAVTYNLTGYPMLRQARALVEQGEIGEVRQVMVEYLQGQLHQRIEDGDPGRLRWRLTPGRAGASLVLVDIGSHAWNLVEFVTGQPGEALCADVGATVPGREVHDFAGMLLRLRNGARGLLCVTQAACGMENDVRLRVVGSGGTLEWRQGDAQHLYLSRQGQPQLRWSAGSPAVLGPAREVSVLPPGHPQGYVETFAVLYREFRAAIDGHCPPALPGLEAARSCARFVEAALASSRSGGWVPLQPS